MNTRLKLFLILLCTGSCVVAQNIKNERMGVKYLQLPYKPLDKQFSTYRKTIELLALAVDDSREAITAKISDRLSLDSLTETQSGADLEFYVRVEPFVIDNFNVTSSQHTETKSDKTKVTYTYYTARCMVRYPMYFKIRNIKEDQMIFEGYINNSDKYYETSESSRSYDNAKSQLNSKAKGYKSSLFNNNLSKLNSHIVDNYSYTPSKHYWSVNYVESSKKANYDDLVAAKDSTKLALESLSDQSAELSEESKAKLSKAIEMWQKILIESNPDDKKARIDKKVTMAIHENIAYCYFFLRNFSEAEKVAAASLDIREQLWHEELKQSIMDMKRRLEANNVLFN